MYLFFFSQKKVFIYQMHAVRLNWFWQYVGLSGYSRTDLDTQDIHQHLGGDQKRSQFSENCYFAAPMFINISERPRCGVCLHIWVRPCCVCLGFLADFPVSGHPSGKMLHVWWWKWGSQTGLNWCYGSSPVCSILILFTHVEVLYSYLPRRSVPTFCFQFPIQIQHTSWGNIASPLFLCLSFFSLSFFFDLPLSLPLTFPSHPILLSSPFFNFKMLWSQRQTGDPLPSPETKLWDYLPFFLHCTFIKGKAPWEGFIRTISGFNTPLENMLILVLNEVLCNTVPGGTISIDMRWNL